QRLAMHVVHHEEELALLAKHVVCGDHTRVLDPRGQPRLVEEHRDELGVRREILVQTLDGDGSGETHIGYESPEMNGGHSARRDWLVERIATNYALRAQFRVGHWTPRLEVGRPREPR